MRKRKRKGEIELNSFDTRHLSISKFEFTKEYQCVKEKFVYSHEWFEARSFQADETEDYNSRREEGSWEFSRKCALRDIHRFDPSVRLYVYVFLESVLNASCNTGGNKARKRFSATSWRCFNAMKTVSALPREEKQTCLFQHVHFLVRTSRLVRKKFQQWN